MSEVCPWVRSGLTVPLNAIRVPSGDQEKLPTLKSRPLVRCVGVAGLRSASPTSIVKT